MLSLCNIMPGSLHSKNFGKFLPDTRISERIIHVGITVEDRAVADAFYRDILGCHDIWHGGMKDDRVDWVDMRVPDGTDWLEYMLNVNNPSPQVTGRDASSGAGCAERRCGIQDAAGTRYENRTRGRRSGGMGSGSSTFMIRI